MENMDLKFNRLSHRRQKQITKTALLRKYVEKHAEPMPNNEAPLETILARLNGSHLPKNAGLSKEQIQSIKDDATKHGGRMWLNNQPNRRQRRSI